MPMDDDDEGSMLPNRAAGRTPGPGAFFVGMVLLGMIMALVALLKQRV